MQILLPCVRGKEGKDSRKVKLSACQAEKEDAVPVYRLLGWIKKTNMAYDLSRGCRWATAGETTAWRTSSSWAVPLTKAVPTM